MPASAMSFPTRYATVRCQRQLFTAIQSNLVIKLDLFWRNLFSQLLYLQHHLLSDQSLLPSNLPHRNCDATDSLTQHAIGHNRDS